MNLKTIAFIIVVIIFFFFKESKAQDAKTNIIFILVDDLGYGELSSYNPDAPVKTPNIDRISKAGVRMMQAYASPVCSPTRTAFLTGKFPQKSGVYGNFSGANPGIGPGRIAFPDILQKKGYRTAWFGKWHQGWDISNHPLNNGFDVSYGFLGGMHDYWEVSNGDHYVGGPFSPNSYVFDGFKVVTNMNYFTNEITQRAINEINRTSKKPFFIYLAYSTPHTPMQAPDSTVLNFLKQTTDTIKATRYAMVDNLDHNVGLILDHLKEKRLDKNTLVVFMSDNGAEDQIYNGGLRGTKMTVWEGGIRVPLIASLPDRIPVNTMSGSICSITDLAATFINVASKNEGDSFGDGFNLMPYWQGKKKDDVHKGLVFSVGMKGKSGELPTIDNIELLGVRLGDWKWVKDEKRNIDALYNLADDLSEKNDFSQKRPEKKAELIKYTEYYLSQCLPDCGKIANKNTRSNGNELKTEEQKARIRALKY